MNKHLDLMKCNRYNIERSQTKWSAYFEAYGYEWSLFTYWLSGSDSDSSMSQDGELGSCASWQLLFAISTSAPSIVPVVAISSEIYQVWLISSKRS